MQLWKEMSLNWPVFWAAHAGFNEWIACMYNKKHQKLMFEIMINKHFKIKAIRMQKELFRPETIVANFCHSHGAYLQNCSLIIYRHHFCHILRNCRQVQIKRLRIRRKQKYILNNDIVYVWQLSCRNTQIFWQKVHFRWVRAEVKNCPRKHKILYLCEIFRKLQKFTRAWNMNQVNGSSLLVNFLSITIEIRKKSAAFYAFLISGPAKRKQA